MHFICKQKPLSISQLKRNPFKKTPTSNGKAGNNAFKHLTDTAIGFDTHETPDMEFDDDLPSNTHDTEKENLNTDNSSPKVAVSNFFVSIFSLKKIFNMQNKIIVFNVFNVLDAKANVHGFL